MDLSKLCIDTSSTEDYENLNSFQSSNSVTYLHKDMWYITYQLMLKKNGFDNSSQNTSTLTSINNAGEQRRINQEDPTSQLQSCNSSRLKHVIELCTLLQKGILKYRTQPFTEELRSIMLNQVYGITSEMLDSLKCLQGSEGIHDIPLLSEQYQNINEYGIIRQARNLGDTVVPKYRRRSKRSMVGQYCHSCKTTETPEWRRGPDGARTLCNACGLHYSKLLRKGSLTVQTHSYLIEPTSTYQTMRSPESTVPRNQNIPYLPSINGVILYNANNESA